MFLIGSAFSACGAILAHFLVEEIPLGEDLSRAEAIFETYRYQDAEDHTL